MKKVSLLLISVLIFICGCNKFDANKEKNNFVKKVNNADSYYIKGTMDIYDNEDKFSYDIEVTKKDDKYKVEMINKTNDNRQIILKNDEGTFVATPSLNKSFKFQSDWPNNSSQSYILASLVNDIKNDPEAKLTENKDNYVLKLKVNYPNNENLEYEELIFDKNMDLLKVNVYDEDNNLVIETIFNKIDFKTSVDDKTFLLANYIDEECCEETPSSGLVDNIIYPMYMPQDTYLKDKETINTDESERVILTFAGLKNFILVEETVKISDEFEIIPVYGDLMFLNETYGVLSANSVNWTNAGIEYYLTSSDLTTEEMYKIAISLNNSNSISVGK